MHKLSSKIRGKDFQRSFSKVFHEIVLKIFRHHCPENIKYSKLTILGRQYCKLIEGTRPNTLRMNRTHAAAVEDWKNFGILDVKKR